MKLLSFSAKKKFNYSILLFILMLFLLVIVCLFVYSSSFYSAEITYNYKFYFLKKQLFGIVVGLVCYFVFSKIDYHFYSKIKWYLFAVSLILLALVFVPKIGVTNYGATRWINLGFITFQPSEIAKFSFIILSADILSKSENIIKSFKGIIPILIIGGIYCVLIIIEPNMSITICMALLVVVMLFLGGMSFKHFLILSVPAVMVVVLLIVVEPYRLKRLVAFLDPFDSKQDEGFHLVQSLLGLALGSFFGSGIFNSRQKYLFLPFSESDFIFSIIAEETGFVGSLFVLILFLSLFFVIIKIAKVSKDKFGFLLASGIGSLIIIQVLLNISVVTGLVPPTGLPLPFISAGSTSLIVFMSAIGVVLNVYRQSRKSKI